MDSGWLFPSCRRQRAAARVRRGAPFRGSPALAAAGRLGYRAGGRWPAAGPAIWNIRIAHAVSAQGCQLDLV